MYPSCVQHSIIPRIQSKLIRFGPRSKSRTFWIWTQPQADSSPIPSHGLQILVIPTHALNACFFLLLGFTHVSLAGVACLRASTWLTSVYPSRSLLGQLFLKESFSPPIAPKTGHDMPLMCLCSTWPHSSQHLTSCSGSRAGLWAWWHFQS